MAFKNKKTLRNRECKEEKRKKKYRGVGNWRTASTDSIKIWNGEDEEEEE
jgi:hypothetical protein